MTKRNAESASRSRGLSQEARESAATGLERISTMGRTLTSVKGAVGQMESAVSEMQSSSQEIAKIIKTIDEIAFQTNLLALNAAVEAARAGEAGAGFAVVADEVRSLAQRSAQAAKDTSEKIEAAIRRSEFGGVASAKVVQSLGEVETNSTRIGEALQAIVREVASLDEVINQIASASHEQSSGVNEVNSAVTCIDKATQTNAMNAQRNAAAAQELQGQAATLHALVGDLQGLVDGARESARAGMALAPASVSKRITAAHAVRTPEHEAPVVAKASSIPMPDEMGMASPGHRSNGRAPESKLRHGSSVNGSSRLPAVNGGFHDF